LASCGQIWCYGCEKYIRDVFWGGRLIESNWYGMKLWLLQWVSAESVFVDWNYIYYIIYIRLLSRWIILDVKISRCIFLILRIREEACSLEWCEPMLPQS
jgi:hypothetical protein